MELLPAELLATVSHELRSPLASIKGYTATLLRHDHHLDQEERTEFLRAINEGSLRLEHLIDQLLELSQVETQKVSFVPLPLHLPSLVQEVIATTRPFRGGMPLQQRTLFQQNDGVVEQAEERLIVSGDRRLLRILLDSLFENAQLYSPPASLIEVGVCAMKDQWLHYTPEAFHNQEQQVILLSPLSQKEDQGLIEFWIKDHGIGIAAEYLQTIFERFSRVDMRLTREANGLGIGLTICRGIVELHNGGLWVESAIGSGSTFHILLPQIALSQRRKDTMPAKKTTIVIADDDPQLLRLIARNLEFEGYEVQTAGDGQQALELIERWSPDLVLLDVMMPRMDGFTVCQRVREFSNIPIILVTARGQDQDKVKGLDLGADDYLTKPFSVDELLARVRSVLRRTQFASNEQTHNLQPTITIGEMTIDYAQHLVSIAGKEITLSPIEYRILAYLAQNAGRVVTQDLLLNHVWGPEYLGESHMLQVNINRLRRKLEADPTHPRYLKTKVGIGYLLATSPTT